MGEVSGCLYETEDDLGECAFDMDEPAGRLRARQACLLKVWPSAIGSKPHASSSTSQSMHSTSLPL